MKRGDYQQHARMMDQEDYTNHGSHVHSSTIRVDDDGDYDDALEEGVVTPPTAREDRILMGGTSGSSLLGEHLMMTNTFSSPPTSLPSQQLSLSPPPIEPKAPTVTSHIVEDAPSYSSHSTKYRNRRPPLAPHYTNTANNSTSASASTAGIRQQQQQQQKHHKRAVSGGDQSFLSALTGASDDVNQDAVLQPARTRGVSWEFDDSPSPGSLSTGNPPSILQPILVDDNDNVDVQTAQNVPAAPTPIRVIKNKKWSKSTEPKEKQPIRRRTTKASSSAHGGAAAAATAAGGGGGGSQIASARILTVQDIAGPHETEAEAAILEAVENREKELQAAEDGPSAADRRVSSLLPSFPDNAVHMLEDPKTEQEQQQQQKEQEEDQTNGQGNNNLPKKHANSAPQLVLDNTISKLAGHLKQMRAFASDNAGEIRSRFDWSGNPNEADGDDVNENDNGKKNDSRVSGTVVTRAISATDSLFNNMDLLLRRRSSSKKKHAQGYEDTEVGQEAENEEEVTHYQKDRRRRCRPTCCSQSTCCGAFVNEINLLRSFLRRGEKDVKIYAKRFLFFVFLPAMGLSAVCYYSGNPTFNGTSYSWLVQFICIRQVITFALSVLLQTIIIDFFCLRSRLILHMFGPLVTLTIVESRGWPGIFIFWFLVNICFLSGGTRFADHWLFFQDFMPMFNESNPAGDGTSAVLYLDILNTMFIAGIATALKRVYVAYYLGTRTYSHFGAQMVNILKDMMIVVEVAALAREANEKKENITASARDLLQFSNDQVNPSWDFYDESYSDRHEAVSVSPTGQNSQGETTSHEKSTATSPSTPKMARLFPTKKESTRRSKDQVSAAHLKLLDLMEEWQEPSRSTGELNGDISLNDVLHFRKTLALMDGDFPFSSSFGNARTRENCVKSSHSVYMDLLRRTPDENILPFETIAGLALDERGELNQTKARELINFFRPDRDGSLPLVAFAKAIDRIYKELRFFRAAVANSSQIDRALEHIINTAFFITLGMLCLSILNIVDTLAVLVSLNGLIISFSFMIGKASSSYFEGLLFILVRMPYNIGDRIAVDNANNEADINGANSWYVEGVTLFTTTVRYGMSNEVATIANGTLANSRVINAARSPNAIVYIDLKFAIDVPYEKVKIFGSSIERFVKARPREWISLLSFSSRRVEVDLGYILYRVSLQHCESWQNMKAIVQSKADVSSYANEVAKQLGMRYTTPILPIKFEKERKES